MLVWIAASIIIVLLIWAIYTNKEGLLQYKFEKEKNYAGNDIIPDMTTTNLPVSQCIKKCTDTEACVMMVSDQIDDYTNATCYYKSKIPSRSFVANNSFVWTKKDVSSTEVAYSQVIRNNFTGDFIGTYNNTNKQKCQEMCEQNDQCKSFMMPSAITNTCSLKSTNAGARDTNLWTATAFNTYTKETNGLCDDKQTPKFDKTGTNCKAEFTEFQDTFDIQGQSLLWYNVKDASECETDCRLFRDPLTNKRCGGFVYEKNNKVCHIKGDAYKMNRSNPNLQGAILAPLGVCPNNKKIPKLDEAGTNCKIEFTPALNNMDLVFNDVKINDQYVNHISSGPEDCMNTCRFTAGCKVISYNKNTKECFPKTSAPNNKDGSYRRKDNNFSSYISAPFGFCKDASGNEINNIPKTDTTGNNCANYFEPIKGTHFASNDIFGSNPSFGPVSEDECAQACLTTEGCNNYAYYNPSQIS
jgi:hypothetical protein